jgi:glycosyltransferase involved in cell wall biosynthesis
MMRNIPKHYLSKLYRKLKTTINPKRYSVILNVNGVDESNYTKLALLIYIVRPFQLRDEDPELFRHQHLKQCKQIAAILGESGYIVDVVDIRNWIFRPYRDYDLVISNRVVDTHLKKDAIRIYLATTLYHILHNRNLRRRHKLLNERRRYRVKLRRVYAEAMPYVERSNAIVCFGNEFTMSSWREAFNIPVYPFNNYGFKHTEFILEFKDFSTARKNFLFLASRSQTQKGLDLLLEIFPKHPNLHLYICSAYNSERDFSSCYYKELYETANIHPIGWVRVNSPEYNELVRKCAFVILPSCSEGQSGSVVQCMYSGLIPLVTREVGIDTEDFGITFADDSLEEIERVIVEVSEKPETWHKEHSIRTREVSEQKYSEDAFMNRWRYILGEILNSAGDKR